MKTRFLPLHLELDIFQKFRKYIFIWYPYFLVLIVSLPFLNYFLVADDEFMVFYASSRYISDYDLVFKDWAHSALTGLESYGQIRIFLYFIYYNGFVITGLIARTLNIDLILAFGIFRILTILFLLAGVNSVVKAIFSSKNINQNLIKNKLRLTSISTLMFSLTLVSNSPYGGFRAAPAVYTITSAALAFLVAKFITILKYYISERSVAVRVKKIHVLYLLLLGVTSALTNEITQIMLPISIGIFVFFIYLRKDLFKILIKLQLVYLVSFGLFFVPLRIAISRFCTKEAPCYEPSSISVENFSPATAIYVFFSQFPYFSTRNLDLNISNLNLLHAIAILIFIFFVIYNFIYFVELKKYVLEEEYKKFHIYLSFYLGVIFLAVTAIGTSFRAVNKNFNISILKYIGTTTLEAPVLSIGVTLILVSIFIFLFKLKNFFILFAVSILFSSFLILSSVLNMETSKKNNANISHVVMQRISIELSNPSLDFNQDEYRCMLVSVKLNEASRWEGHDRAVFQGVNSLFKNQNGIDFCIDTQRLLDEKYS